MIGVIQKLSISWEFHTQQYLNNKLTRFLSPQPFQVYPQLPNQLFPVQTIQSFNNFGFGPIFCLGMYACLTIYMFIYDMGTNFFFHGFFRTLNWRVLKERITSGCVENNFRPYHTSHCRLLFYNSNLLGVLFLS